MLFLYYYLGIFDEMGDFCQVIPMKWQTRGTVL